MRIVMLCRLYHPHVGGVERHVRAVASRLIQTGDSVEIFTLPHRIDLPSNELDGGISIRRKPTIIRSRLLRPLLLFFTRLFHITRGRRIAEAIGERDEIWGWLVWNLPSFLHADVIHIHDVFFWYWPLRLLLPWKKVTITFHGFEAGKLPNVKSIRARKLAVRMTNGSIGVGSWITKWYHTPLTYVTYGGAECGSRTSTAEYPAIGYSVDPRIRKKLQAVFVGRLDHDTGVMAYCTAITNQREIFLTVYGDGPLRGDVEELATKSSMIRYVGKTTDSCGVFRAADIACVSSYLSILEALQCRLPVVSYASDALKIDYLLSLPVANGIAIATTEQELVDILQNVPAQECSAAREEAYTWAAAQTWDQVVALYRRLWST